MSHEVHHARQLLGVGIAIRHPHHRLSNRTVRNHQADVETNALLVVARSLLREIGRAPAIGVDEHGRDALSQHRLPVFEFGGGEAATGVGVDIDEAGGQRQAVGIDRLGGQGAVEIANRLNAIAGHADIGADPRVAVPVEDVRVANQEIEA